MDDGFRPKLYRRFWAKLAPFLQNRRFSIDIAKQVAVFITKARFPVHERIRYEQRTLLVSPSEGGSKRKKAVFRLKLHFT